jgi:hypothetical protein
MYLRHSGAESARACPSGHGDSIPLPASTAVRSTKADGRSGGMAAILLVSPEEIFANSLAFVLSRQSHRRVGSYGGGDLGLRNGGRRDQCARRRTTEVAWFGALGPQTKVCPTGAHSTKSTESGTARSRSGTELAGLAASVSPIPCVPDGAGPFGSKSSTWCPRPSA